MFEQVVWLSYGLGHSDKVGEIRSRGWSVGSTGGVERGGEPDAGALLQC